MGYFFTESFNNLYLSFSKSLQGCHISFFCFSIHLSNSLSFSTFFRFFCVSMDFFVLVNRLYIISLSNYIRFKKDMRLSMRKYSYIIIYLFRLKTPSVKQCSRMLLKLQWKLSVNLCLRPSVILL